MGIDAQLAAGALSLSGGADKPKEPRIGLLRLLTTQSTWGMHFLGEIEERAPEVIRHMGSIGNERTHALEVYRNSQQASTSARVKHAIDELLAEGLRVSFYSVAQRAQIARSTLYRRPDLKALVEAARPQPKNVDRAPTCTRIDQLEAEIARLKEKLRTAMSTGAHVSYYRISL